MDRLRTDIGEGRRDVQLADQLRLRRIADIDIDDIGRIASADHLAVGTDIRRTVKALIEAGGGFTVFLARLPPLADFGRMRRIAHIHDDEDVAALEAGIAGREISVFAAGIGIAMRAGRAAGPFADLFRIDRIGDVPKDHRRARIGMVLVAVQRGDHQIVVQRDLRRHDPFGAVVRDELRENGLLRICDVEDAPAAVPQVARVHVPLVAHVADHHLERAAFASDARIADGSHVGQSRALRNRITCRYAHSRQNTCQRHRYRLLFHSHSSPMNYYL